MSLVEELRSKQSRDNRELLDRAADMIEELEKKADLNFCGVALMLALKKNERLQFEVDALKIANEKMYSANKAQEAEVERLQKAYNGLVADVKTCGVRDVCFICKAYNLHPDCECDCMECKLDCPCRECRECSHWKWRGEK